MGFFKSFKKNPFKAAIGGGIGGAALGPAGALLGAKVGSTTKASSIQDLFLGKKQKDINPDEIANQIRDTQSKGVSELNAALDGTSSADIVTQGAEQAKKGILTSAQDARRQAQQSMAQQGLKGTSLGLGLNRSINQSTGDSIANVNAQVPGQIRNQSIQDAQTRIGVGGINQSGMNFNTIQGQRTGGILGIAGALAPIAGTVAGGVMGGPAGASAGGQAGQGIGGALQQQRNPQGAYNPNSYSMGNYQF